MLCCHVIPTYRQTVVTRTNFSKLGTKVWPGLLGPFELDTVGRIPVGVLNDEINTYFKGTYALNFFAALNQ